MKKGATPELNAKWWNTNQPADLATARDLTKALSAYELALGKFADEATDPNHKACEKALDQIEAAAKKTADEAGDCVDKPPKKTKATPDDFKFTAEALKKYPKAVADARKELGEQLKEALAEADDEDETENPGGLLNDEKAYQAYLKKSLQKIKKKPMNFAVGFGLKPEEHRFMFHKAKSGKSMFATIKAETKLKKLTFGLAGAHGEKPDTLVLALEGMQIPGIKKKTEKLLKHFKPLPFAKVMLMVEGNEAQDIADPEDPADEEDQAPDTAQPTPTVTESKPAPKGDPTAFKTRMAEVLRRIQEAAATNDPKAAAAKQKATEAGVIARSQDFVAALAALEEAASMLGAAPSPEKGQAVERALTKWRTTRGEVVGSLKDLAKEIAGSKHAAAKNAILEINAVIKNLTADPDTAQKVAELERWIGQDDVVFDVSDLAHDIRSPLLEVLGELKQALAA